MFCVLFLFCSDTMPLCKVFSQGGQEMNINEQQDVNEFCARLFDQMESDLKKTNKRSVIEKYFGGMLANQIISKDQVLSE